MVGWSGNVGKVSYELSGPGSNRPRRFDPLDSQAPGRAFRMKELSVVMICYNEESILGKSLSSVRWADEIVIVDSYSTDGTLEVARQYTERIVQHAWQGYGRQKNLALTYASCPWILSLDADEVVTKELEKEIRALLTQGPECTGYRIPRMTCYLGTLLRHTWYPDYKLRLFQKDCVIWGEEGVHESVRLEGSQGQLKNPLIHYSFPTISDHIRTLQRYTTLGAEERMNAGKAFSLVRMFVSPLAMFWKQYVMKRGFLDGLPGLIACVLSGVHEFVKYAKLYELQMRDRKKIVAQVPGEKDSP